jgi:hypothetical protein
VPKLKALQSVAIATKADRLREVWPEIEQKLARGASHAHVLRALNEDGYELTERTYKSYVYRLRKERRWPDSKVPRAAVGAASSAASATAQTATPERKAPTPGQRPRTFDYDPRGIPDLLK